MDSARALIARGWGVSLVSRCLRVSRAQLHVILRRTDDWKDGRRSRHSDDTDVLLRIHHVIGELPTYGYRRVWALLRRQAELDGMPAINAKRVYRIMRQNALLLERKPAVPPSKRAHTGRVAVKESNQRWCSDGFEFRCDNGEKLRVTFALDCCDREALHWAVTTGGFDSETVQDVMLGAVERRFGNELPASPVEWLTDNGSCYRANETRQFARMLGLEPKNTAVRSPESNGIAESFVKTIKRDYISIMPKPDGLTAAKNLAEAFEHYNEWHPHSALGYRSPREYLRQRASNGLSDNRCLESKLCFFSVVQVTDTDARVFFYDFLRLFQNIQLHLPAAYFLIQSCDFLPQRIAFCLQGRFVMFTHSLVSTVADNFIFLFI